MKILLTGGGTGGHITPILAVAHEIRRAQPSAQIIYVGERGGKFGHMMADEATIDQTKMIFAGKFRRYHGESWLKHLLDIKTVWLNLRDVFLVTVGFFQSLFLLARLKPDVIFLKGGFVGVPVGLAAVLLGVPFMTHDSDAVPGLANRLVGKWARRHATGLPANYYKYQSDKVDHVGVLVSEAYRPVDSELQAAYKSEIGLPNASRLLLITGGSLGAARLNAAVQSLVPQLLNAYSDLSIVHQVGKGKSRIYDQYQHDRLQVLEFLKPMHKFTGAADVVVSRAGANTLAELGVQGKACIVVPNPQLTGGHQLKNAAYLADQEAIKLVAESELATSYEPLLVAIHSLLDDPKLAKLLSQNIQKVTKTNAAEQVARLLIGIAQENDPK